MQCVIKDGCLLPKMTAVAEDVNLLKSSGLATKSHESAIDIMGVEASSESLFSLFRSPRIITVSLERIENILKVGEAEKDPVN
ncbi:hypothetical protein SUGI_0878180 [Cryptomeria japonica]|nr:hypothetical protein SUGI_0878180 [Cryptomeria japonica]